MRGKRVIVLGGMGFIGRALARLLLEKGYEVVVLTRNPERARRLGQEDFKLVAWDGISSQGWEAYAEGAFGIVNLVGENIGRGRWTKKKKEEIIRSRLNAGRAVVDAVHVASAKPRVVIQASAIGFYGHRPEEELRESSSAGAGFLSHVVQMWEGSTHGVEALGVRRVIIRSGVVLGRGGGVLPRFLLPFRFFTGGPLGRGKQWLSWISLVDESRAILFLLENASHSGIFNLTAPTPLREKEFARILGRVTGRPSWFPVPVFILKLIFGSMARETLLVSQKVLPVRLLASGFQFTHPKAESALGDIINPNI